MDFLDKLGKKASEAYKVTADKTGKIAKEAKLKLKMSELKGQINDIYEEIGKKVYEKHIRGEAVDIQKDLEEECTQVDVLSAEIEDMLKECMDLKDKKQCQKCYTQIEKEAKFCPECGEKQQDSVKEVELLSQVEETGTESQEHAEADEYIDSEIEATSDVEKQNSEEEQKEIDEESREDLEKTVEIESDIDDE